MARVLTGLDRLLSDSNLLKELEGKSLGLLVNPTSVTHDLTHAIDALLAKNVRIVRLFGPEHGIRGEAQDMESVVEDYDPITGIPTISLYGHTLESLQPSSAQLQGLDLVIADIQDIGSRYYTYVYSIGLMMEACGRAEIPVWVLDRPNPIGGLAVEGNTVLSGYRSFVGMQPIAVRHGMTAGELAHFFSKYGGWTCEFRVIEMSGWTREMWFEDTGLPWVMPSPNMPTNDTATVYPGQCLLEGTNVSEGRGTTRPFEIFGAPWIDARELKQALRQHSLPGVAFREISFRPKFQKHADVTCAGLQIHVTDRVAYDNLGTSFAIMVELRRLYPDDFMWREEAYEFVKDRLAIDLLLGDPILRKGIEDGQDPVELAHATGAGRTEFDAQRAECLIYS